MRRFAALMIVLAVPVVVRGDVFDHYTNLILEKVPAAAGTKKVGKLTAESLVEHARVLPGITSAFVVVRTNDGRWAKLLVQPARQKVGPDRQVPILLIERYVTFREGEERTIHARGESLSLFHDFRLSLDLGQVVPGDVPADIRLQATGDDVYVEAVGKAEIFLVTKHLDEANPRQGEKLVVGEVFRPEYFAGAYRLFDDGRRSGTLHLQVAANQGVSGFYYSGKDGQKYEVTGKVGAVHHTIQFQIIFPRTQQFFRGWLFTGDGQVMTGFSRLGEREFGFYAQRIEGDGK